jgi:penicillin-binding protein 1C
MFKNCVKNIYELTQKYKQLLSKHFFLRLVNKVFIVFIFVYLLLRLIPYPDLNKFLKSTVSTRFYDRNGNIVQIVPLENGLRREKISIEEITPYIGDVFIRAEDSRFYYHAGIDVISIIRAGIQNIKGSRYVSGASTITMQLARIISTRNANSIRFSISFSTFSPF